MKDTLFAVQKDREEAHENRLLRVPEVAERLSLGLTKTWELINRGEIPSIQIGRCRRVRERDLEAWIDEQEVDR